MYWSENWLIQSLLGTLLGFAFVVGLICYLSAQITISKPSIPLLKAPSLLVFVAATIATWSPRLISNSRNSAGDSHQNRISTTSKQELHSVSK